MQADFNAARKMTDEERFRYGNPQSFHPDDPRLK
jgi:hypothetical protein